ncbi:MAG: hypothetical protein M0R06_26725, partial [Sphaerochaeta sp.]|nr:hypothetical protein [Sphaerochaeta sp.]
MEDHKDGITITIHADAVGEKLFSEALNQHKPEGPDILSIATPVEKITLGERKILDKGIFNLNFRTTFAPGPEFGRLRCIIAGELTTIEGMEITPEDWRRLADKLTKRNELLGYLVPDGTPRRGRALDFRVAAGFVPMHKLAERNRAGLP